MSAALETTETTEASLIGSLLLLGKSTRALMGLKLAEIGLCSGQDELLLALDHHGTRSVSELAELVCVRPSTVSKMLDRLMTTGLVVRTHDEHDKRQTLVSLTDGGREMIGRIRTLHSHLDGELAQHRTSEGVGLRPNDIVELSTLVSGRLRRLR